MKNETLNTSTKKLCESAVHNYKGFSPGVSTVDTALKLAKLLGGDGFTSMNTKDINDQTKAHSDPLEDEELTDMMKSASVEEKKDPGEEADPSLECLYSGTNGKKIKIQRMAEGWDPQMIHMLICCYSEIQLMES